MSLADHLIERFERILGPHLAFQVRNAGNDNRPRAYAGPYPIRSHRTLAEVWGCNDDGPDAA